MGIIRSEWDNEGIQNRFFIWLWLSDSSLSLVKGEGGVDGRGRGRGGRGRVVKPMGYTSPPLINSPQ